MPIGYGYQSSDAASYVNWAAVTKGFTDVLDADIADREKRKSEYEKQDRELSQTLANQPLGQFEDGNTFTNNFVDSMTNQRLIDYKLFKAGRLKEKDYRLKTNNAIDGTNTIFDLQKKYQEAAADRMKGLQDGTYQPLTSSNMALIEGFKDFKDSVPIVDPKTGIINIAKKKYNEKTKTWDIEYGKTMPVNMAMNLISTPAAAYKIDPIIDNAVASMGTLKDALYNAATINGAGTITELTGPEGFQKYPGAADVITNFNNAINGKVEEYLTDPLHMTSVLTMNVGGYSAESFTYDKAEAAKDPSKILMKIDPSSKYPTMDQSGPNYKKQKEEAAGWIKTQFMSRIDRERKITTTSQVSRNEPSATMLARTTTVNASENLGQQLGKYLTGDLTTASNANTYLKEFGIQTQKIKVDGKPMVRFYNNEGKSFDYDPKQKTRELIKSAVAGIGTLIKDKELFEDKVVNAAIKEAGGRSVTFDAVGGGYEGPKNYTKDINSYVSSSLDSQIIPQKATKTAANLNSEFGALGFTFEANEDVYSGTTDDIIIYKKGQDTSKEKGVTFSVDDKSQVEKILEWLTQNANATEAETFFVNNPDKQAKDEPAPNPDQAP